MRKYNVENYIRYKEDVKQVLSSKLYERNDYENLTRDQIIVKFLPLVENIARKFSTAQVASGVLQITDLIQEGSIGLVYAVDRLKQKKLDQSKDKDKTIKSFLSKRINGSIRRAIDINRGSYDKPNNDDNMIYQIPDTSTPHSEQMLNNYLKSLLKKYLNMKEYEVLRLSYGLDCERLSAKEIADRLQIKGSSSYVRVSQLKKQAVKRLIDNVDHSQVVDYLPVT